MLVNYVSYYHMILSIYANHKLLPLLSLFCLFIILMNIIKVNLVKSCQKLKHGLMFRTK